MPHGYDGTGPEHSSSKIERFLQLTDNNGVNALDEYTTDHRSVNICVAQPTTPANYFHLLRRQMMRQYRKPLVVITPKIGLRHPAYVSRIDEFSKGNRFQPVILDNYCKDSTTPKAIVFCTGQMFLEYKKLAENMQKENNSCPNIVVIRIEELSPFPEKNIIDVLKSFKLNKECQFYWSQEESMNAGAFTFTVPFLTRIMRKLEMKSREVNYIGRPAQVSANGCVDDHKKESAEITQKISKLFR